MQLNFFCPAAVFRFARFTIMWYGYYSILVSSLCQSVFPFSLSLIVVLPCMCRPSSGNVVVKTLLGARRNRLNMTVHSFQRCLIDSVMDLIRLRVSGTSWWPDRELRRPPCFDGMFKRPETSKWLSWKLRLSGSVLEILGEEDTIVWYLFVVSFPPPSIPARRRIILDRPRRVQERPILSPAQRAAHEKRARLKVDGGSLSVWC